MYVPIFISPNQWSKYNKLTCFQYPIPNILILHPSPWKILSVANCQIANSKINTNSYNYLPLQIQKHSFLVRLISSDFRSISRVTFGLLAVTFDPFALTLRCTRRRFSRYKYARSI